MKQKLCVWGRFKHLQEQEQNMKIKQIQLSVNIDIIACGADHFLIYSKDNCSLFSMGNNKYGQLGLKTKQQSITKPQQVNLAIYSHIQQLACGNQHSLILDIEGNVYGCGRTEFGAVGIETNQNCYEFEPVMRGVSLIAAGARHSLAVNLYKRVYGWGDSQQGQLGIKQRHQNKFMKPISLDIMQTKLIAAHGNISLFLTEKNIYGCGSNNLGQLGLGHKQIVYEPQIINIEDEIEILIACNYSVGITPKKEIYLFGSGAFGELLYPVKMELPNVEEMYMGDTFGFIKSKNNRIYTWGSNKYGQLGFDDKICKSSPVINKNLQNIKKICCGKNFAIAICNEIKISYLEQSPNQNNSGKKNSEYYQNAELSKYNRILKQKVQLLENQNRQLKKSLESKMSSKKYDTQLSDDLSLLEKQIRQYKLECYKKTKLCEVLTHENKHLKQKNLRYYDQNKSMKNLMKQLRAGLEKSQGIGRFLEFRQMESTLLLYQEELRQSKKACQNIKYSLIKLKKQYNIVNDSIQSNEFVRLFFSNTSYQKITEHISRAYRQNIQNMNVLFKDLFTHTNQLKNILEQIYLEIQQQ